MSGEWLAIKAIGVCICSLGDFSEEVGQQLSEEGDLDAKELAELADDAACMGLW